MIPYHKCCARMPATASSPTGSVQAFLHPTDTVPPLQQDDPDWETHPPLESSEASMFDWAWVSSRALHPCSDFGLLLAAGWLGLQAAAATAGAAAQWRYVMASCVRTTRRPLLLRTATLLSCLPLAAFPMTFVCAVTDVYCSWRERALARSGGLRLQPAAPGTAQYLEQAVLISSGSVAAPPWPFPERDPDDGQPLPAWVDASDVSSESARIQYKRRLYEQWGYTAADLRARQELHSAARWIALSPVAVDLLYLGLALRYRHAPPRLARVWAERRAAAGEARRWHVHAAPAACIAYASAVGVGSWTVVDWIEQQLVQRLQSLYNERILSRLEPAHSAYRRVCALPDYFPRPSVGTLCAVDPSLMFFLE